MSKKPLSGILAAPAAAHVVPDASGPVQSAQAAPSASPAVTPSTVDVRCNNCGNFGHTYQNCITRKKNNSRCGRSKRRSSGGTSSSLSQSDVTQVVDLLQRLTHQGSSGPTDFSQSSPGLLGQSDTWDWPL
uniref:CCHC-type domain-containing protein n=1 Tax=Arundo donax TaxID=35708 RepID=A0A0A9HIV3_ARUDO